MSSALITLRMKLVRRNLLAIVPVSLLALFGEAAQAATGPKLKPTKLGQKIVFRGYTYIVVKSKGKLIWKRGAKVVSKLPTTKPSPSASASPTASQTAGALVFVAKSSEIMEGEGKIVEVKPANASVFPVSVTRANGVVRVVSAICTHNGCVVNFMSGQLTCPCHGSEFNAVTGAVNQGPARSSLRKYVASEDAGSIFVLV